MSKYLISLFSQLFLLAVLLFSHNSANAAITYINSASNPTDNSNTNPAQPVAVTPPGGMAAGDLVILVANTTVNTVTMTMSATGGQTWNALTNISTTGSQRIFWARYNGTWSANPSVTFSNTSNTTVVMHVFRPSSGSNTWAIDVAQTSSASTPTGGNDDVTIGSITTNTNGALVFATWTSVDNNQWSLQTAGWNNAGNSQYRNRASTDASQSSAYLVKATAGTTGAVVNRQTSSGPDNGNISILAFKEVPSISINLASPDPTTPATAVSWTVVFGSSVTGVTAANFALVQAGGVSGATITSVTGSGTTWTVNANTGTGTGTLGLNMVNVTGISPTVTTTLPVVGQVYTVSTPMVCLTDSFSTTGTLDTTLWDVRTILGPFLPKVINAGGGDYRLRLTDTGGNEATFAQLKRTFPGAGNKIVVEIDYFAYGGSGADGIAITFSDSAVSSTTGGFGGSLGYAQNNTNAGFGGGWLGIGLDEYGNFPNPTESRNGYPAGWTAPAPANVAAGFYKTNIAVRGSGSGTSGYYLLANTGVLATPVAPPSGAAGATPYRYRFTVDHSNGTNAWVTVERDLTAPLGDVYTVVVPTFDVKAASSGQAAVPPSWKLSFTGSTGGSTNFHEIKQLSVCANSIMGGGPHHFEIQHASGTGLTCTPSTLTIKACADAAVPCTPYTAGVSGTLSATGSPTVNWTGGTGFTIASGSSTVTKDVQVTTVGNVLFDATSSPIPTAATTCNFGTPSCTFASADAGFLFNVLDHASETLQNITVSAIKKADNSLACTPAFGSVSKSLIFTCGYTNPATGTLPVRVGGQALNAGNNAGAACDGTGQAVSLAFNASGLANTTVQYADVGNLTLNARYTGSGADAGLVMTGADSFIAVPATFGFSAITAGPIKAGNNFSATVTAKNSAGATTPNFGKEATAEGVTLSSNLVSPVGGANPVPGGNVILGASFTNGVATVNNLTWGEVGNITLTAALTSGNYLASGQTATGTSATVGAFIPDHLDTAVVATASTPMPCPAGLTCPASKDLLDGFVYSGQPFSVQVTAKNLAGGTTANYDGTLGFSKAVTLTAWDALGSIVTQDPGSGTLTGSIPASAFNAGVATTAAPTYTFAAVPTAPTDIFLRAVDADNVSSRRAIPATSVEGGVKVASGRLKIGNSHGSELLDLPMTVRVQYYSGSRWLTSDTDSVTQFDSNIDPAGNIVPVVVKGPLALADVNVVSPGPVTFASGVTTIELAKPGVAGGANITINAPAYLPSTTGLATFGVYKGAKEFIYQRENY